jgi:hypothetical protein
MGKRTRTSSPRGLTAYQRMRRQEWKGTLTTDVVALGGRLIATLGLELEQPGARLYKGEYLTLREKQVAVLRSEAGA